MTGLGAVVNLRFREAVAGRILWLLPVHFVAAMALVRGIPGPTVEARLAAANATALPLAAALAVVAAAMLGAAPLAEERLRPRGALLLAAPVSPLARVLGTALGAGGALALLTAGLLASALAAVDLGVGTAGPPPTAWIRASAIEGGTADPREEGLVWLTAETPRATIVFEVSSSIPETPSEVLLEARPRVGRDGAMAGRKSLEVPDRGPRPHGDRDGKRTVVHAAHSEPLVVPVAGHPRRMEVARVPGNLDLGLRTEDIALRDGPRPRALSFALHGAALLAGLLALMTACMALSTATGTGVAAAGGLALTLLSFSRGHFADAATMLAHAGAMEEALHASQGLDAHTHASIGTGTPPALAPLFGALASVVPDGTRFDLGAELVRNRVPDFGDVQGAMAAGAGMTLLFLALAAAGAGRRP